MTYPEWINQLEGDEKELAIKYWPVFSHLSLERIEELVSAILAGNWQAAYRATVATMTLAEATAEIAALHAELTALNSENAAAIQQVKNFMAELLAVAFKFLAAALAGI